MRRMGGLGKGLPIFCVRITEPAEAALRRPLTVIEKSLGDGG